MNRKMMCLVMLVLWSVSAAPALANTSTAPQAAEELLFTEPLADGTIRLVACGQLLPDTGISIEGRTFVSLRTMSGLVTDLVEWDVEKQTVTIAPESAASKGAALMLVMGEKQYYHNGSAFQLDVPPQLVGDTPMIPLSVVAELLNGEIQWNETSRTAILTGQQPAATAAAANAAQQKPTAEQAKHEQNALADWGYGLRDGIYIEDMVNEEGYGANFCIVELEADAARPPLAEQTFQLRVTDKYSGRVVYTQSFIYGDQPQELGEMIHLDVPSQYFNENEYSYNIVVGEES